MLQKNITINELIIIEGNFHNAIKPLECSNRMAIGKNKAYYYYKKFKEGKTVELIFAEYKQNKKKCGRSLIVLSKEKLEQVNIKLSKDWSLDAIAGRDKLDGHFETVSTTTLYKMVKRGIISFRRLRRLGKRKKNGQIETRGKNNFGKTIHERDLKYPEANKNLEYGHYEGDTIVGEKRNSAIVTIVEKTTKCIILLKATRKSEDVKNALTEWLKRNEFNPIKSITFDRGKEFSQWLEIEKTVENLNIYFADAGSPGQRGLNENSNGIVRKDLPKSTDLSVHSQEYLNTLANKWNNIPRKILGYLTPMEMLKKMTGLSTII